MAFPVRSCRSTGRAILSVTPARPTLCVFAQWAQEDLRSDLFRVKDRRDRSKSLVMNVPGQRCWSGSIVVWLFRRLNLRSL
jgi:hypothetical protein